MSGYKKSSKAKALRHRNFEYHRNRRQESIASSIRMQENYENRQPNNKMIFDQGEAWFNSGLPLESASKELRENSNFISGFNRAKRLRDVAEYLYNLGIQYAESGISIEQIPEKYRENPDVMRGYNDTLGDRKRK